MSKSELEDLKEHFKLLYMQLAEFDAQVELEQDLHSSLEKSSLICEKTDFDQILDQQTARFVEEGPIIQQINQYLALIKESKTELNRLTLDCNIITSATAEEIQKEIDFITLHNMDLEMEIDNLLDKLVNFDDEELHELRAEKQRLELLSKFAHS